MTVAKKRAKPADPSPADIKAIRLARGLTQEQAAEKVGVSRRSWAAWESGEQIPSPPIVILIRLLQAEKI